MTLPTMAVITVVLLVSALMFYAAHKLSET